MIDKFGYADLGMFEATAGWSVLTVEQRSLMVAYLRRSETWPLRSVLDNIGANVDLPSITPTMPQPALAVTSAAMIPAMVPVMNNNNDNNALPPLNAHNQVPVVIPPTSTELEEMRRQWDREWKRKQGSSAKGKEEDDGPADVTLTREEVAQVTQRARQRSAEVSGHGRKPHGGYASSSSAATLEADRQRSETAAIEKALRDALARKKNGGTA